VPQIEVTFDIDSNGILNVSAKDKATNKEQRIRIESSSGLSKDEVERMRRDAEAHSSEDKERRELVELKNQVDHLVYETDKQLQQHGDKLSADDKQAIETARDELKQAAQGTDRAKLESALRDFQTKAQRLGEVLYKQSAEKGAAEGAGAAAGPGPKATTGQKGGDEPVDADFEVKT
jgi:molecular chaperone DnaK